MLGAHSDDIGCGGTVRFPLERHPGAEVRWVVFAAGRIPRYDPDLGNPNLFVPLTRAQAEEKVATLVAEFPSQRHRVWFTPDTFMILMQLRGMQCNAPSRFAEGFHAPKLRL